MKNNYLKLKLSILLQTVLVTAITVLVGGFLLNYVVDGIYNDSFAKTFVSVLMSMHVKEDFCFYSRYFFMWRCRR